MEELEPQNPQIDTSGVGRVDDERRARARDYAEQVASNYAGLDAGEIQLKAIAGGGFRVQGATDEGQRDMARWNIAQNNEDIDEDDIFVEQTDDGGYNAYLTEQAQRERTTEQIQSEYPYLEPGEDFNVETSEDGEASIYFTDEGRKEQVRQQIAASDSNLDPEDVVVNEGDYDPGNLRVDGDSRYAQDRFDIGLSDDVSAYFGEQSRAGEGPNPADERGSQRVGGTGDPTDSPTPGREDAINEMLGQVDGRTTEQVIEERIAEKNEDLDPSDIIVTERSAENVTNLDIRKDIAENPYQVRFTDQYKREQLSEFSDTLESENPTLDLNVVENDNGEPTLERNEKYGDFAGEHLPGLENWVDEYAEENEYLLPGADWVESKAESADDFPLMLPTGQRVNVSGKKTTEGLASMYASVDLAELPKEAVEGAELVEHLVAPDQLVRGFGGEQQEANTEVQSRFADVGEAGGFLRDEGVEYAQKDPAGAIGKGTVLAGGIVVGSVAETAALRAVTRGARGLSTPDVGVDMDTPSLSQYTPDVELSPDVNVVRSRDAPTIDVNVNTGVYRGVRQSGRNVIGSVESGLNSVTGTTNYARFVAPRKAESVRDTVSNLPENAAQSSQRLAREIEDFRRQAKIEYAERAAGAKRHINRFLADERSGSAPPAPTLRSPSGSGRFNGRVGDITDAAVERANYARFVAPRKAAAARETISNFPENAALSARRLERDIQDYRQAVKAEAGFAFSEGAARAQQSFNRFLADERSGSAPFSPDMSNGDYSFVDAFPYSPSDVTDAARGFGNYLDFRADVAGAQASDRLASIPGELGQSVRRTRRAVSGVGASTVTRPLFDARNELANYSLRVDVGKPRREQTPWFDTDELDDVDVEFTGEVETFDPDADADVSNPGGVDIDVENRGDGGQTTVTQKRARRDEPGQPEGIGDEFDMGGRSPGATPGAFGIGQGSESVGENMGDLFGDTQDSGVDYNQGPIFDEESVVGPEIDVGEAQAADFGVSGRAGADFGYSSIDSLDYGATVDSDMYVAQDIDVAARPWLAADTELAQPAGGKRPWGPWPDDSDIDRPEVGGGRDLDEDTWYNSIAKLGQY